MTWIKLDDQAVDHPKIAGLTDRAFRWWIRALCYSSRFLTDGILPKPFTRQVPKQVRAELTSAGLWVFDDPSLRIHDYLEHQTSKEDVEKERRRNRDRRKHDRGTTERRTAGTTTENPPPENRDQNTEHRKQTTAPPSPPPRPLVSGEANPRTWGKLHSEHVIGFCDWVCLPEFVFAEFSRKSARGDTADAYVREWATSIRARFEGQAIGDNLKFWRARWDEDHAVVKPKFSVADALARKAAER